jgi:inner membrane protein
MKRKVSTLELAGRIWALTALFVATGISSFLFIAEGDFPFFGFFVIGLATFIGSLPSLVALLVILPMIRNSSSTDRNKIMNALKLLLGISLSYGLGFAMLDTGIKIFSRNDGMGFLWAMLTGTAIIFVLSLFACTFLWNTLTRYMSPYDSDALALHKFFSIYSTSTIKNNRYMEPSNLQTAQPANRTMVKGFITGGLILLMLIPTFFINSLITEREARQKEIVKEVSSKWATAQTLSSPFLVVPYSYSYQSSDGKPLIAKKNLILLANEVAVNGNIFPEQRTRSIYKVLLYRSDIKFTGSFKVTLPADIDSSEIDYANAKLCFTLSDFKGIEEEIYVNLDQKKLLLLPGLPVNDFGKTGLSAPVSLSPDVLATGLSFDMQVKIKGSEQLHFTPMSASSKFLLQSKWPGPSFDGEMLPNERTINDSGFISRWSFNQANLPFATVIHENTVGDKKMDFGVSLVQPADQYAKTMRSVKYAILFIGLTFAFFFIIELMQKKPFHPVQYVLVGLALVIFYTLLLSVSEYIPFDFAYLTAALATVLLISLYAKGHFNSWKTAGIFFFLLSCLYGFIFILIRLEDTALLVGSIGLFLVLALVMFASRRINWYGNTQPVLIPVNDQNNQHV